ncbi:hypothetical protein HDV05_003382 [Chytridiales sp. JEL 0842]|nr:hypothetical protein HDV05_003382 [Chytridiales sp. JEL 0842]
MFVPRSIKKPSQSQQPQKRTSRLPRNVIPIESNAIAEKSTFANVCGAESSSLKRKRDVTTHLAVTDRKRPPNGLNTSNAASKPATSSSITTEPTELNLKKSKPLNDNNNNNTNITNNPPQPKSDTPYGNYPSYYSRRHQGPLASLHRRLDERLEYFDLHWITDKRILDIGCNMGHVSVSLAMLMNPKMVVGVDIDPDLIKKARRNLGYRYSLLEIGKPKDAFKTKRYKKDLGLDVDYFPMTCPILLGSLPIIRTEPITEEDLLDAGGFPNNISFRCGNFVSEPIPLKEEEKFDTILALSVTKWIQINWGDSGLKTFFAKCYSALRKGGVFIVEPQPREGGGYTRGRNAAKSGGKGEGGSGEMSMMPSEFPEYLTGTVGFKSYQKLVGASDSTSLKGYKRDMYAFFK